MWKGLNIVAKSLMQVHRSASPAAYNMYNNIFIFNVFTCTSHITGIIMVV